MNTSENISNEILKAELELKRLEIFAKEREHNKPTRRWKLTIETATIIVAVIAFTGTFLATFLQGFFAKKQQRKEFESTLIIKAVETGSSETSKKNIKFLLDVGLISEKEWKINLRRILSDTSYRITYGSSNDDVIYICLNSNSFSYHSNRMCKALKLCTDTILSISVIEARYQYNRRPCNFCY